LKRALERENLIVAEATAREVGALTLLEALELTALIAQKEPQRLPLESLAFRLAKDTGTWRAFERQPQTRPIEFRIIGCAGVRQCSRRPGGAPPSQSE
jgi:hypothetical protein